MKTLLIRSLAGAVFGIIMIASILLGQHVFGVLMMIVSLIAFSEYITFFIPQLNKQLKFLILFIALLISLVIFSVINGYLAKEFLFSIPIFAGLLLFEGLFIQWKIVFQKIAGLIYIVLPLNILILLYHFANGEFYLLLSFFIIIWMNDTFAYFTGSLIGKHKLAPNISPKKTIEGSLGGLIFSLITAFILHILFGEGSLIHWIVFAFIIVVFGSLGDLLESKLKRVANVKDSGNVIPGHGGLFDRFDSAILATPFIILYLFLSAK